jgi:phospholipid/cholesterol/gamma-HCH transport system permease protein
MIWYKPAAVGFAVRRQLDGLGSGARLFYRLLTTLGGSLKRLSILGLDFILTAMMFTI